MSSRTQRDTKLKERCKALADVVESVGPIYHSATTTKDQRHFIETIIGAALWYLPVPDECWTGKVSVEAITIQILETKTRDLQQIMSIHERSLRPIYSQGTQAAAQTWKMNSSRYI